MTSKLKVLPKHKLNIFLVLINVCCFKNFNTLGLLIHVNEDFFLVCMQNDNYKIIHIDCLFSMKMLI